MLNRINFPPMKDYLTIVLVSVVSITLLVLPAGGVAARARIPSKTDTPYRGAIVIRADTGETLFEKNSDTPCYPASIVKLMMLLIIQEKIEKGFLHLDERVVCTAEAARMGGSQVFLKENEIFTVEELLYALIIQSANDAAVALALHVAGSKDGFVEMMQERGRELGMKETEFHSVHGLPPGKGQKPDFSTPRDITILCRELLKHPAILRYTSTQVRGFRDDSFEMRSHNPLLKSMEGDGLKTGFFRAGGFSIAATSNRGGIRLIAVVMGSKKKEERNNAVRELLAQSFSSLPSSASGKRHIQPALRKQKQTVARREPAPAQLKEVDLPEDKLVEIKKTGGGFWKTLLLILIFLVQAAFFFWLGRRSRREKSSGYLPNILQK